MMIMLSERTRRDGYVPPIAGCGTSDRGARGVEVMATLGLALALVVAMTAVSIGIARAETLHTFAQGDRTAFALALFVGLLLAGMGGLTALVTRGPRRRN
jgi:hypothetical protein